jgi:VWFA-related protein
MHVYSRYFMKLICLTLLLSLVSFTLIAQKPAPPVPPAPKQAQSAEQQSSQPSEQQGIATTDQSYKVSVNVVNLLATVRGKDGRIINTLSQSDFTLEDDGKPALIRYFSKDNDLPLTLGLLIDTSLSQRRVLDQERAASQTFLDQMMRENKDFAFIIQFDKEVELLQDITNSRKLLQTALGQVDAPSLQRRDGNGPNGNDPRGARGQGRGRGGFANAGTLLYDAIYLASNELMMKQRGRKAIIVLTDGEDHGSKVGMLSAIEAAQRSETLVYTILFKDKEENNRGGFSGPFGRGGGRDRDGGGRGGRGGGGYPGGGQGGGRYPQDEKREDGKKVLERISKDTGARMFEVTKKQTVGDIYAQISEELRSQYSIGFTPEGTTPAQGYHTITLTVKPKNMSVQTRPGYYVGR